MERVCEKCEHFSPAHTCIEKPVWGYCMRLAKSGMGEQKGSLRFTWADSQCNEFRQRLAVPAHHQV